MMNLKRLCVLVAMLVLLNGQNAYASAPADITDEEYAFLPEWCNHVQTAKPRPDIKSQYSEYLQRFGPGWSHVHHYCWALIDINRLNRARSRTERGYGNWTSALGNLDYVLRLTTKDFVLHQEIMIQKARLLTRHDRPDRAQAVIEQILKEWPKSPDGYILYARLLLNNKQREKALEILATGDRNVEDQERYAKLKTTLPSM